MAKEYFKYECGHEGMKILYGPYKERDEIINHLKNIPCKECQRKKLIEEGYDVQLIHYSDYKNNYSHYKTIEDSYDRKTKEIMVIIPKNEKLEAENDVVVMPYREYKNKYSKFKTVANSYNPATKEIEVIIPKPEKTVDEKLDEIEQVELVDKKLESLRSDDIEKIGEEFGEDFKTRWYRFSKACEMYDISKKDKLKLFKQIDIWMELSIDEKVKILKYSKIGQEKSVSKFIWNKILEYMNGKIPSIHKIKEKLAA